MYKLQLTTASRLKGGASSQERPLWCSRRPRCARAQSASMHNALVPVSCTFQCFSVVFCGPGVGSPLSVQPDSAATALAHKVLLMLPAACTNLVVLQLATGTPRICVNTSENGIVINPHTLNMQVGCPALNQCEWRRLMFVC